MAEVGYTNAEMQDQGAAHGAWELTVGAGHKTPIEFEATANFLTGLQLFVVRGRIRRDRSDPRESSALD